MKKEEQPQGKRLGTLKNGGIPCDIRSLPKCQAKAKSTGKRCGNIAIKGIRVCYLHGGRGGAKRGNKNALKTGLHTAETKALQKHLQQLVKASRELLGQL